MGTDALYFGRLRRCLRINLSPIFTDRSSLPSISPATGTCPASMKFGARLSDNLLTSTSPAPVLPVSCAFPLIIKEHFSTATTNSTAKQAQHWTDCTTPVCIAEHLILLYFTGSTLGHYWTYSVSIQFHTPSCSGSCSSQWRFLLREPSQTQGVQHLAFFS
jgi:hypothetical protein